MHVCFWRAVVVPGSHGEDQLIAHSAFIPSIWLNTGHVKSYPKGLGLQRDYGKIWFWLTFSLPCCVSLRKAWFCMCVRVFLCVHSKANCRPTACKLSVTCEAAATLYGEHSISVQLDLAKHSGSREERVCMRGWLCLHDCVYVCVRLSVFMHLTGGVTERGGKLKRKGKNK